MRLLINLPLILIRFCGLIILVAFLILGWIVGHTYTFMRIGFATGVSESSKFMSLALARFGTKRETEK